MPHRQRHASPPRRHGRRPSVGKGRGDYGLLESGTPLDPKGHWMLMAGRNAEAAERLRRIDFHALAHEGSITPGFGLSDVVAAYQRTGRERVEL